MFSCINGLEVNQYRKWSDSSPLRVECLGIDKD